MKGDSYGRRFTDRAPISAQFLSDNHAPGEVDHAKHLRLVFDACRRGFTWLVKP